MEPVEQSCMLFYVIYGFISSSIELTMRLCLPFKKHLK